MEAATEATENQGDAPVETSPAEGRHPQELFRYSEWVHVGPGADECDDAETGECTNNMHFHAWCRLPNQFQHQSIREKGLAAKARRLRAYRDADSDASAVLDGQLDEIEYTMGVEDARKTYIEEIVFKDYMKDYFDAVQELASEQADGDDPDEPGPWVTIDEDRERFRVLELMDEEERPHDEYAELKSHLQAYEDEVNRLVKDVKQEPLRQSLQDRSMDDLRAMVREDRIQKEANALYMQTYTIWEQFIGTMKTQVPKALDAPQQRAFTDVNHLKAAAPEIVQALDRVFTDLDGEFGKTLTQGAEGKG